MKKILKKCAVTTYFIAYIATFIYAFMLVKK